MISRPQNKNIYMISENEYNELTKAKRNADYLEKLQRGIVTLNVGKGVEHEIIED